MKTLLIAICTALSITSFGQDMQQYLSATQEMVNQKKYKEALERYIWFQDHALEKDQSMVGVRLSFALSSWKSLADIYPPAMIALKERCLSKTKAVLDSNASPDLFADVAALNRILGEPNKTIELFENITQLHPDKSKLYWYYAKDALFSTKRYDIIKKYIVNPIDEFAIIKSRHELLNAFQEKNSVSRPEQRVFRDNFFVEKSLELIQYSIAVNDLKSAKEIRRKAMSTVSDNRLKDFQID